MISETENFLQKNRREKNGEEMIYVYSRQTLRETTGLRFINQLLYVIPFSA